MAVYVILGMLTLSTLQFALCAKTTCTASAGTKGEQATITCHFKGNVSQENDSVSIHKLGDGKANKGSILDCFWEGDGLQCYNRTGYMYDGKDWRNLTVIIPAVTENHVGQYVCQTMMSDADDHVSCKLTLRDTSVSECRRESASNCTAPGDGAASNCAASGDGLCTCCIVFIALTALGIVVGTASFIWVVFRCCKRGRQTDRTTPNDTSIPFSPGTRCHKRRRQTDGTTLNDTSKPFISPGTSVSYRVPRHLSPRIKEKFQLFESGGNAILVSQNRSQSGNADEGYGDSAHSDFQTDDAHSLKLTVSGSIPSSKKGDGTQQTQL